MAGILEALQAERLAQEGRFAPDDQAMKQQQFQQQQLAQRQAMQQAAQQNAMKQQQFQQQQAMQQQAMQKQQALDKAQQAGLSDYVNYLKNPEMSPAQPEMRNGQPAVNPTGYGPDVKPVYAMKPPEAAPMTFETVSRSILKNKPDITPDEFSAAMEKFAPQFAMQDKMKLAQFTAVARQQARGTAPGAGTVEQQIYATALKNGKSPDEAANMAANYKRSQGIPGAKLTAGGDIEMRQGGTSAIQEAAKAKSAGAEEGKTVADMPAIARGTKDVLNTYELLKKDAAKAPSGAAESALASLANVANVPTEGSKAQASFEANANNLYLATIRTLKGTGRVMQSELQNIKDASPKPTDSMEVKQAKIDAHMAYYKKRMEDLGFDPDTGKPIKGAEQPTEQPAPKTINFADLPE